MKKKRRREDEKTLAVYGVKSHHVRTVRKAAKDPWIKNESTPTGCVQFEPSWLVDPEQQSTPPWSAAFSEAKAAIPDDGRLRELPSRSFAVINILGLFFCEL